MLDEGITEPVALVEILKRFFEHVPPEFEGWIDAVQHFQDRVPELGRALKELIEREEKTNARFRAAFDDFFALCRQSINPNLSKEAVEEMLIQQAPNQPLNWRVERMKLSKDKRWLIYNDFLTLSGMPPEVFEYRLGNRSALDWIIDQYQVSTDKRSGITNDPNRADDPQYIVRLIGQVITISLETVTLVASLFNIPLVPKAE